VVFVAGLTRETLRSGLDAQYSAFDAANAVADPINIVRRYSRPDDLEIVAFCAAALAFGRVASVMQSVEALCHVLGPSPARFVRNFEADRHREELRGLVHRWIRGADLMALLVILRHMLETAGSIEGFFADGDDPSSPDVGAALNTFSARALAIDVGSAYGRLPKRPGVCYFFPRPAAGSACKRLNLFLRWMVRRDQVDFGVWTRVSPARLVIPLDTHVIRLGRCLRLTTYRSPGWKMAADITKSLRQLSPDDPVRYDFSLCHVGMMGACGYQTRQRDAQCPFKGVCRPRGK